MNVIALLALAVCAVALPMGTDIQVGMVQGNDVVRAQVADVTVNGQQTVAIDVSNDFVDSLGDDHKMEVLLDVTVTSGVVAINNKPAAIGTVMTMQVVATLSESIRSTGAVVRQDPKSVTVQVVVQEAQQLSQGVMVSALQVQELVQEVDGTRLTQVEVQETVITLDENGNEASRVSGLIALQDSLLATTTPSPSYVNLGDDVMSTQISDTDTPAEDPTKGTSDSDSDSSSSDSSDSSDSSSDSDGMGEDRSDEKQRLRRIGRWIGKVLLVAAITFLSVMSVICLLRCVRRMCCGVPTSRVVNANNGNKLHYVPLAVDDVLDFKSNKETTVNF